MPFHRICVLLAILFSSTLYAKPRLLITTDIGGDPDDSQSLVRLLTCANEFDIKGLIASASGTPGELGKAITRPDLIEERVRAYGQVLPNLKKHAPNYPDMEYLLERIKSGNPQRGSSAIGEGHDSEASNFIITVVDQADSRPLNIAIWGGQTDLAQALWRVQHDRSKDQLNAFISKIRVYDIADQDGLFEWIHQRFPNLWYILNKAPEGVDKREAVFRGMYLDGDLSKTATKWLRTNITTDHGPLGELYPDEGLWTAPNPHGALKEGDTPSWFYFLPLGLHDPSHPNFGGWGGRFERAEHNLFRDAMDSVGELENARLTVARWRKHFQRDFTARMDWCVQDVDHANHPPVVVVDGDSSSQVIYQSARPGAKFEFLAQHSFDPDCDQLSFQWWIYDEPSTVNQELVQLESSGAACELEIGDVEEPFSIHLIVEVTDDGSPKLTRYRRIVLHSESFF